MLWSESLTEQMFNMLTHKALSGSSNNIVVIVSVSFKTVISKILSTCIPPSQLAVFCEGTRFTQQKHLVSMKYAVKKNLKPLKHHLLPRTRGFSMLSNGMRDFGEF